MKLVDILREMEMGPTEISVLVSSDALLRCNLEIALESIWMDSGYKDWMYRVDPEDPRIPLQRHIHIAKKKHTSTKNMQASWNADGTRHDKKSFNTSVGETGRVREIARNVLSIGSEIALESINAPRSDRVLIDDIAFSSDGKVAYVAISTS